MDVMNFVEGVEVVMAVVACDWLGRKSVDQLKARLEAGCAEES